MSETDLVCDNCGEDADSLLGGECIHTCSEVVTNDDLRELAEGWREKAEANGEPASRFYKHFASELEGFIDE